MNIKILTVLAGAFCVALTGCQTIQTGGVEVTVEEYGPMKLRVDDRHFAGQISVENAKLRRTDDGFIIADVLIRNCQAVDVCLEYKFSFYDSDGMSVQSGGRAWEQKVLHGGELVSLTATGPEKTVAKFVLRLRRTY